MAHRWCRLGLLLLYALGTESFQRMARLRPLRMASNNRPLRAVPTGVLPPQLPFTSRLQQVSPPGDMERTDEPTLPFRIDYDEVSDTFLFQTASIRLSKPGLEIDLIATVHVAEPQYYAELEQRCNRYDAVLYETITSEANIATDTQGWQRLAVSLCPTGELERMASLHGLAAQLNHMDPVRREKWYLSDISREALTELQGSQGERQLDDLRNVPLLQRAAELGEIFWEGFTSKGLLMPKLFLRGGSFVRLLRFGLWFTPCPELQLMLLDWSRQYPPAGGLSSLLRAMLGALSRGDLATLRRLAFSQMLTSSQKGVSTLGQSGGQKGRSVLIGERNSKVVLDLLKAAEDPTIGEGPTRRVAVLYGGLHLMDLESKVLTHLRMTRSSPTWQTAWSMREGPSTSRGLVSVLCIAAPLLYLAIGGWDWSDTFSTVAVDVSTAADPWAEIVQGIGAYVLRHVLMYYGLTRWVVQWDRNLFDAAGEEGR